MLPISICIIMKNEEKHLERCLSSIQKHLPPDSYELILVDTGSTDNTMHIASRYTNQLYHFQWCNDFSAARNYSLQCATHDWVLVLDCDEFIENLDITCFDQMVQQYPQGIGMLSRQNHYTQAETDCIYTDEVERFFDRRFFHYEDRIHEQVRPITLIKKVKRISLPIIVTHSGYDGTPEELTAKANRNNELLFQMLQQNPNDPYIYFQLGQSFHVLHDTEKTCYYYGKGLEFDVNPQAEYVQLMVIGYGYSLLDLGRYQDALQFQNIYNEFCSTSDFVCLMGLIYLRNGMIPEAISEFQKATCFTQSKTTGTNSYIPYYNLGCIYEVLGDFNNAAGFYQKCGGFPPAQERLKAMKLL